MARPVGKCPLCDNARPLCESHLISKLCYRPARDNDKQQMYRVSAEPNPPKIVQDGAKEYLLCGCCERHLNENFEQPFEDYWMRSERLQEGLRLQPPRVEGLPYREFKLFHLSVLWRMGAARTLGFEHFDLGAHANVLKAMIRDGDPGAPEVYSFGATALLDDSGAVVFDLVGAAEPQAREPRTGHGDVRGLLLGIHADERRLRHPCDSTTNPVSR